MKKENYTLALRVLHWSIALTMLFLLITIFLRLNWMNKHHMADILTQELSKVDMNLDQDQAIVIAKAIRKPMWNWHVYAGYLLSGLFILKMILFSVQGAVFRSPFSKESTTKEKFQSWVYILFYVLLSVSLVTGLLIVLGPKEYKHDIETIHKPAIYWLMAYVVLHFGGLLMGELSSDKGMVSKMIHGGKK